jgi:cell division protein ZapA (FtsZ GTPase activity inhibitor)
MKTIEVEIFNSRFAVCEHKNEDYLRALAAEVDARIQ